jgi:putative ABC transport system permease protein
MDAVLLRPLPYAEADRLVAVCETNPSVDRFCVASPPDVEDWAAASRTVSGIGFARSWLFVLRTADGATGVNGGFASPAWFRVLEVRPAMGRLFTEADLGGGANRVTVLTHALWVERFGSDADIVGRTVPLDGEQFTVIGVLPPSFVAPQLEYVRLWTPPPWDPRDEERRGWRGFQVVGRLATGATIEQASAELASLQVGLAREHPQTNEGWGVRVHSLHEQVTGATKPLFLLFGAAVTLLLLIACANLANLMLVRASNRRREMAVRAAIGAGQARLVRPLLIESAMISLSGGLLGLLLANAMTRGFIRLAPAGIPRLADARINGTAFAFALLLALGTAVLFGLWPALRAARVDPARGLREGPGGGKGIGAGRSRRILASTEIALTLMLLVGTGLLGRSLGSLLRWDPGFDRGGLLAFSAFASNGTYANAESVGALWRRVEEEIGEVPGVVSAGAVSAGPVFGGIEPGRFAIVGRPVEAEPPSVRWYDASPGYFRTMGVAIRQGRDLSESDVRGATPVAVVNEAFARRWFASQDPLGQRIRMFEDGVELEIVGVAADVPPFFAGQPIEPEIWWSNRQQPRWATYFIVRAAGDPGATAQAVRRRIADIDPDIQIGSPNTIDQLIDRRLVGPRFNLALVGILATVALVLAVSGLYAVMSFAVANRGREIAIRMALGARRGSVLAGVLSDAGIAVAAGLATGGVASILLVRFLTSMLYGVAPRDPVTFAGTALLLSVVAFVASAVPAVRATRVDPATVLRQE